MCVDLRHEYTSKLVKSLQNHYPKTKMVEKSALNPMLPPKGAIPRNYPRSVKACMTSQIQNDLQLR